MPDADIDLGLLKHQREVFCNPEATRVFYAKGRRVGGTMGASRRLMQIALQEHPGSAHLWIDTVHRNINRYIKRYFMPPLRPLNGMRVGWHDGTAGPFFKWNGHDMILQFFNGSYCDFGSAERPELLEGFGYDYFWINEAGHVLQDESLYQNTLKPMGFDSPKAKWFVFGRPLGRNLFCKLYEEAEREQGAGNRAYLAVRHSSFTNPTLNRAEIDAFMAEMPEAVVRQEIHAEFVDDAASFFRFVDRQATAQEESGATDPRCGYVLGVDLAQVHDWTVCWVGRGDLRKAVAVERFNRLPWEEQFRRIKQLCDKFNCGTVVVDATAATAQCEALEAMGVPVMRYTFTAATKLKLLGSLAVALEQGKFTFLPHRQTISELKDFRAERLPSGTLRLSAPEGEDKFDDCVMALALCWWGMNGWEAKPVTVGKSKLWGGADG